jgi:UDP-N-acetylmuramate dehydrogenase
MLVDVADAAALPELFGYAMLRDGPVLVLGGGSNLLFAGDAPGAVLALSSQRIELLGDDGDAAIVRADAGVGWHDFVMWTLGHGLCGLENLALIPGTVGAAPIQNIGAYGVEVRDAHPRRACVRSPAPRFRTLDAGDCASPTATACSSTIPIATSSPPSSSCCRARRTCAWTTPASARNWRRWASTARRAPRRWPRR